MNISRKIHSNFSKNDRQRLHSKFDLASVNSVLNTNLPTLASTYRGAESNSGGQANSSTCKLANCCPANLGGWAHFGSTEWGTLLDTSQFFRGRKRQSQPHGLLANSMTCNPERKKIKFIIIDFDYFRQRRYVFFKSIIQHNDIVTVLVSWIEV